MKQFPLLIGNGRLAKHFAKYFELLNIPYIKWDRKSNADLKTLLPDASQVLLMISDSAIDSFIEENLLDATVPIIHFSGAFTSKYAHSYHPLQTFAAELYTLPEYKELPFITDSKDNLLSYLPNKTFYIEKKDKAYYHAICVIANNFTTIIWQKFFHELEHKLGIEQEYLKPILRKTMENIDTNPYKALTGPIARGDLDTIKANIDALEGDGFQEIYKAFANLHRTSGDVFRRAVIASPLGRGNPFLGQKRRVDCRASLAMTGRSNEHPQELLHSTEDSSKPDTEFILPTSNEDK